MPLEIDWLCRKHHLETHPHSDDVPLNSIISTRGRRRHEKPSPGAIRQRKYSEKQRLLKKAEREEQE